MSVISIRAALEAALDELLPPLPTVWENTEFTPASNSEPYQSVYLLLAQPDNRESGRQFTQSGYMQVSLHYPPNAGPGAAMARAEAIRAAFWRGRTLTSGSVQVTINKTPEIAPALPDGDRYVLPVRVRFFAPINA